MMQKKILRPERLRSVPAQCSWIDQRLVRDNYLRHGQPAAWALYLVLVSVADAKGLSYYSDATLSRLLRLDPVELSRARAQLVAADLVASQSPLYQVLALPQAAALAPVARLGESLSAGDILRRVIGGGAL